MYTREPRRRDTHQPVNGAITEQPYSTVQAIGYHAEYEHHLCIVGPINSNYMQENVPHPVCR